MGIYDSINLPQLPELSLEGIKQKLPLLGVIVILLIMVVVGVTLLQTDPLQVQLNGLINLSTDKDGYPIQPNTELKITITNPTNETAQNVNVFVRPIDERALLVFPDTTVLDTLDKSRTITVSVRPNPTIRILSGVYRIEVRTILHGEEFVEMVDVPVENPEQK